MTAKQYLSQVRALDVRIDQKIQEKEDLFSRALGNGSPALDPNKVQTSACGDPMGAAVDRYVDMEKEIDEMIDSFVDLKHRIIDQIQQLSDPRYIELLYLHYIKYKRLEEVACMMRKRDGGVYSYDHIVRIHGEALQEFARCHSNAM